MASKQTLDLVREWWNIFDHYHLFELLHAMVLERDWSRVRFIYIVSSRQL
jgi:hypothetical protein